MEILEMKNFVSEPCKNSNNTVHLASVALNTNGTKWFVTGHLLVDSTLEAPVKALIKMERRIFYRWIKLPCVGDFGSCEYSDVCALMADYEACGEDPSSGQTVPCKCPIHRGTYAIKMESDHQVISAFQAVLKGSYRASLNMFKNDESIACYNIKFKITT